MLNSESGRARATWARAIRDEKIYLQGNAVASIGKANVINKLEKAVAMGSVKMKAQNKINLLRTLQEALGNWRLL